MIKQMSSDGELDANETSSSASSAPSSDVESVCSEVRARGDVADEVLPFQGPWVLNCASGVVHRLDGGVRRSLHRLPPLCCAAPWL